MSISLTQDRPLSQNENNMRREDCQKTQGDACDLLSWASSFLVQDQGICCKNCAHGFWVDDCLCCAQMVELLQHVFLCAPQDHPIAKVEEPLSTDMKWHIKATETKHPMLWEEKVWGAVNSSKIPLQTAGTNLVQKKCHDGWTAGGTCVWL